MLWQLLGECRQANPACHIINLNLEPVEIPEAIHLPLSASAGMIQLEAALKFT